MRRLIAAVAFALLTASPTHSALAQTAHRSGPDHFDLSARSVKYYSNRFIVTADDDVRVVLPRGIVVRGQTFAMDLKLNRYVIAGNVRVDGPGIHETGAGWAGYVDTDRVYFLPATTDAAGEPDRWTYAGTDYAHPLKGRQQPGDAYYLPDLSAEKPWILASSAVVTPATNVEFKGARIYTFGVYTPVASYAVTFSPNPNFAQNALAGATADVGVPYNASRNAVSALHARYDTVRGAYLSFDQHFAWDHDYIVFSVNPATQWYRQYNLVGYKRLSPKLEARVFYQLSSFGHGVVAMPIAESGFGELQVNAGLRRSAVSLTYDQYNNGLVDPYPENPINDPAYIAVKHPSSVGLSWGGYETRINKMPLFYQLRSSLGVAHDAFGIGTFGTATLTSIWTHTFDAKLYTSAIKLDRYGSITIAGEKSRLYYNLPHHVDQTNASVTYSRAYPKEAILLSYGVGTTGDYFGSRQLEFYPPSPNVQTTPYGTYSGLAAFRGFATGRSWTATSNWTPTQNFALSLSVKRNYDWPAPVPGLGGNPPWQFTGDLRVRLAKQIMLDLTRGYYFNFADQRWTPQFQIQFSP